MADKRPPATPQYFSAEKQVKRAASLKNKKVDWTPKQRQDISKALTEQQKAIEDAGRVIVRAALLEAAKRKKPATANEKETGTRHGQLVTKLFKDASSRKGDMSGQIAMTAIGQGKKAPARAAHDYKAYLRKMLLEDDKKRARPKAVAPGHGKII